MKDIELDALYGEPVLFLKTSNTIPEESKVAPKQHLQSTKSVKPKNSSNAVSRKQGLKRDMSDLKNGKKKYRKRVVQRASQLNREASFD